MSSVKYAVIGLGKSGIATARFLKSLGENFYLFDDNKNAIDNYPEFKPNFIDYNNWDWANLKTIVFSPGIATKLPKAHPVAELAIKHNAEIICDIELLYRHKNPKSKIIGITGTNGKSTTTALIYHILKENKFNALIGGNFGIPALELDLKDEHIYVIETSSFQLDLLKDCKFDISIFLNLTPDHMERYNSIENYANSKKRVFKFQTAEDTAILCTDSELMSEIFNNSKKEFKSKFVEYKTGQYFKDIKFENLLGLHNLQNITAAYIACKEIGLSDDVSVSAIHTFKGLPHRMENVAENKKVKFINDSKATNSDATEPALKTFNNIYWLAGGVPKEGGIETLKNYFSKIKYAYFYGQAKEEFAKTYKEAGYKNFKIISDFKSAFKEAKKDAENNYDANQNIVLLSPACASFDEFKNYEERGRIFAELAQKNI